jgi:DNA-binding transcriptional LysR family regulator
MSEKTALLLHKSQAVAANAPGHRLASLEVVTPAELREERVLMPGRNSPLRLSLDRAFSNRDYAPKSMMETSMLNCCCFAASGMGVGVVDRTSIIASGADLVAIPFRPSIEVSYFAIRPSGTLRMPILEELVGRMRELLAS